MLTNTNSIEVYDIAQQKFVHSIISVPTSKSCQKVQIAKLTSKDEGNSYFVVPSAPGCLQVADQELCEGFQINVTGRDILAANNSKVQINILDFAVGGKYAACLIDCVGAVSLTVTNLENK